jgi:hypothetical protein
MDAAKAHHRINHPEPQQVGLETGSMFAHLPRPPTTPSSGIDPGSHPSLALKCLQHLARPIDPDRGIRDRQVHACLTKRDKSFLIPADRPGSTGAGAPSVAKVLAGIPCR